VQGPFVIPAATSIDQTGTQLCGAQSSPVRDNRGLIFHTSIAPEWAERFRVPGLERFHRFDIVVVIQYDRDIVSLAFDLTIDYRVPARFHDGGVDTFVLEHIMQ
jgi:hypothetical protein